MDEAEYCDRIAIMDQGAIVALDTPEALKATRRARTGCRSPPRTTTAAIAALRERFGLEAAIAEGEVTFGVAEGEQFVPRLFAELGVPIRSVSVARPSLDDVFMSYTGSTIRDAEATSADRPPAPFHARMAGGADERIRDSTAPTRRPSPRVRVPGARRRAATCARSRSSGSASCIRFSRDRPRILAALVQPLLFLFVLGTGLSRIASPGTDGVNLRTFIFPGVAGDGGAVHRDLLRGLDRLGPRVRLPARDAGRAGAARLDRARQVPRRRHRRRASRA